MGRLSLLQMIYQGKIVVHNQMGTYWKVLVRVDLVNKPLESSYEGPFKVVV